METHCYSRRLNLLLFRRNERDLAAYGTIRLSIIRKTYDREEDRGKAEDREGGGEADRRRVGMPRLVCRASHASRRKIDGRNGERRFRPWTNCSLASAADRRSRKQDGEPRALGTPVARITKY